MNRISGNKNLLNQELLRKSWENVQTAMRYVNAAAPQLREAHAKASLVDRLLE
ncbi:hypothetical protein HYR54_03975 [Candidatus Acetothermia bacterium]|nr:hypothetical protein [Candidatus Acetothermia bacterium]